MRWNKALDGKSSGGGSKVGLAVNPDKTKVIKIGKWQETHRIKIDEVTTEEVENLCYLVSVLTLNTKQTTVFGKLESIWRSNGCSVVTKVRL